jgi:hypothetical protein
VNWNLEKKKKKKKNRMKKWFKGKEKRNVVHSFLFHFTDVTLQINPYEKKKKKQKKKKKKKKERNLNTDLQCHIINKVR